MELIWSSYASIMLQDNRKRALDEAENGTDCFWGKRISKGSCRISLNQTKDEEVLK